MVQHALKQRVGDSTYFSDNPILFRDRVLGSRSAQRVGMLVVEVIVAEVMCCPRREYVEDHPARHEVEMNACQTP